jgi:hypothetical protein
MRTLLISTTFLAALGFAAASPAQDTDAYTQTIKKRTQDILSVLNLTDSAKVVSVHDAIMAQYRGLKDWHDANDAKLRSLTKRLGQAKSEDAQSAQTEITQIKSSLKTLHDQFLARLSKDLTSEQLERVKDKMTYNIVHVTYRAYGQMLPELPDAQKARILAMLKEAREEAMDGGSAEEKHAVFGRYKGRINNYLAAERYDLKKASKELAEKLKSQRSAEPTEK